MDTRSRVTTHPDGTRDESRYRLLTQARSLNDATDEQLAAAGCYPIKCLRSNNAMRAAHIHILSAWTKFFDNEAERQGLYRGNDIPHGTANIFVMTGLYRSQHRGRVTLKLDVSSVVLDVILTVLYTRKWEIIPDDLLLPTYAACQRFGLIGLANSIASACKRLIERRPDYFDAACEFTNDRKLLVSQGTWTGPAHRGERNFNVGARERNRNEFQFL